MSIKPSVVFIKGVHDIADPNPSTAPDIGFPQLELEKLFEGAALKQIDSGTNYDSNKKYIYKNTAGNIAIQDEGHFNCIKNGYYSIDNGINHYYTKSGDNYNYNAVPSNVDTWAGKWSFSNTIKNKDLYSISNEGALICIEGNDYYKKNSDKYEKQTPKTYTLYEAVDVSWQDQDKYVCKSKPIFDENDNIVGTKNIWQNSKKTLAENGYYVSVLKQNKTDSNGNTEIHYIIQLQYMSFTDGVWDYNSNASTLKIYKFNYNNMDGLYVKNGDHLDDLTNPILFTSDPTTTIEYFYHEMDTWQYPNMLSPSVTPDLMKNPSGSLLSYSAADYPLYKEVIVTTINKVQNTSYTTYEKTAVKINYMYKNDSNSLKFIFTDKTISEVFEACGLDSSLERYVHLTNLEYNGN